MTSGSDYNRCTDIDVGTGICKHDNGACLKAVVDVVDRDYYWESVACNENLQALCEYSCESDDTTVEPDTTTRGGNDDRQERAKTSFCSFTF